MDGMDKNGLLNGQWTMDNGQWTRTAGDIFFVPVPNQRPQEYMIKYEEKNGQLFKKEMITRPVE